MLSDLNNLPFILPVSSKKERKMFEDYLLSKKIARRLSIETSNYISAIEFAKKGLGIALVPKNMIEKDLEIFDIDLKKTITLNYVDANLSPSSREFLKEFQLIDDRCN